MPRSRPRHYAYDLESIEKILPGRGGKVQTAASGVRCHLQGKAYYDSDGLCGHCAALSAVSDYSEHIYDVDNGPPVGKWIVWLKLVIC